MWAASSSLAAPCSQALLPRRSGRLASARLRPRTPPAYRHAVHELLGVYEVADPGFFQAFVDALGGGVVISPSCGVVISLSWRRHDYERPLECLASHRLVLVDSPRRRADCVHPNHHGKFSFFPSQRFPRWPVTPFAGSLFVTTCGARPRPLLELLLRFMQPLIWMLFTLPLGQFILVLLCQHCVWDYVRLTQAVVAAAASAREAPTRGACPYWAPTISLART
ncbi:hypothetical protein V6N12_035399 [Hibiscus sabdariffa]|uniref:Uncharacterized protein n=1 Tax=Hibiscus sabdariffa TaxID=183260 RepID=A0ABR2EML8_9ROSI